MDIDPEPDSALVRFLLNAKYVRFVGRRTIRRYRSTTHGGIRFIFHTRDGGERYLLTDILGNHVYERFPVPSGGAIVDVGANIGIFTVIASKLVGKTGVVAAVEPTPSSYRLMKKNLSMNECENVKTVMVALGEYESEARLYLYDRSTLNSFFIWGKADRRVRRSIEVQVRTLDNLVLDLGLKQLDLLKIDTEGHELPILKGGINTIKRFRPYIIGEAHRTLSDSGWKVASFLSELGYKCKVERNGDYTEMFYADPEKPL